MNDCIYPDWEGGYELGTHNFDKDGYCSICGKFNKLKIQKELKMEQRSLGTIASEISNDWENTYFGALPYLNAMYSLDSIEDNYGLDSGKSIVAYFLANAQTWRGEVARRVKKELKEMLK